MVARLWAGVGAGPGCGLGVGCALHATPCPACTPARGGSALTRPHARNTRVAPTLHLPPMHTHTRTRITHHTHSKHPHARTCACADGGLLHGARPHARALAPHGQHAVQVAAPAHMRHAAAAARPRRLRGRGCRLAPLSSRCVRASWRGTGGRGACSWGCSGAGWRWLLPAIMLPALAPPCPLLREGVKEGWGRPLPATLWPLPLTLLPASGTPAGHPPCWHNSGRAASSSR